MHFFVVHAGLLPYNPRLPIDDPRQPLTHPPRLVNLPPADSTIPGEDVDFTPDNQNILERRDALDDLRQEQEEAILNDIPQNKDPWVVLNMRGVKKNGKITRDTDKGTPWSKLWNTQMKQCAGLPSSDMSSADDDDEEMSFPCEPSTVVYGHAASRGLDVKRYSVGLDTGCLYGQRLTALVVSSGPGGSQGGDEDEDDEDEDKDEDEDRRKRRRSYPSFRRRQKHKGKKVRFGDVAMRLNARLVQVRCSLPPESDPSHDH